MIEGSWARLDIALGSLATILDDYAMDPEGALERWWRRKAPEPQTREVSQVAKSSVGLDELF